MKFPFEGQICFQLLTAKGMDDYGEIGYDVSHLSHDRLSYFRAYNIT